MEANGSPEQLFTQEELAELNGLAFEFQCAVINAGREWRKLSEIVRHEQDNYGLKLEDCWHMLVADAKAKNLDNPNFPETATKAFALVNGYGMEEKDVRRLYEALHKAVPKVINLE